MIFWVFTIWFFNCSDVENVEEKKTEKKVVEVDVEKDEESEEKPKENGKAENGDAKETNGG